MSAPPTNINEMSLGSAINTSSGILAPNALSASIDSNYRWKEPKEGVLATMFPSTYTWHTLYNSDNLEILDNVMAYQNQPGQTAQTASAKIESIVRQVPYVKATSTIIQSCIVIAIILILVIVTSGTTRNIMYVLLGISGVFLIIGIISYVLADGIGEEKWNDFSSKTRGATYSGNQLRMLRKEFMEERQKKEENAYKYSQQRTSGISINL